MRNWRDWFCRTFHHLGWPASDQWGRAYMPCLSCGRFIPIRRGMADIMIHDNRLNRIAEDRARAMYEAHELERWYRGYE